MSMLRQAWFLARKDVQYMLRQRETLLWTFLMPILFFYFIGSATGGFGSRGPTKDRIAVRAPEDGGFLVDEIVRRLELVDYQVDRPAMEAEAAGYRRQLVFPAAFTDSVLGGHSMKVTLVRQGEGAGNDYDQVRVGRAVYGLLADLVVLREEGTVPGGAAFAELAAQPRSVRLEVESAGERRHPPIGFAQAVPGTLVMFTLLVLTTSGSVLLVVERREGLLRRLAVAPMSRATIVLGKWGGRMALAVVQIFFAMVAGTVFFRMDWGPDLPMVALVVLVYAGLIASVALLLGNLARSEGQAVGIGVLAANVMGALGGCWWPIEVTPKVMQKLALFLPTGQAMDALHRLVHFQSGPASAVSHVVILAVATVAVGWISTRIFRFQ